MDSIIYRTVKLKPTSPRGKDKNFSGKRFYVIEQFGEMVVLKDKYKAASQTFMEHNSNIEVLSESAEIPALPFETQLLGLMNSPELVSTMVLNLKKVAELYDREFMPEDIPHLFTGWEKKMSVDGSKEGVSPGVPAGHYYYQNETGIQVAFVKNELYHIDTPAYKSELPYPMSVGRFVSDFFTHKLELSWQISIIKPILFPL